MIQYKIILRDKDGAYVGELTDFISLTITDVANNVGSWRITSRTKSSPPFEPGYGIVVYREGYYLYSGVMEELTADYNPDGSWSWSASGKNDLQLLSYRVIIPAFASSGVLSNRYAEYPYTMPCHAIISALIMENAYYQASQNRSGAMPIIGAPTTAAPITATYPHGSVSYRCDNLLKTVIELANTGNLYIYPTWDESEHRVIYVLSNGWDLSSSIVFSDKRNDVESVHYTMQTPDYTTIVWQYNSEDHSLSSLEPIWKYLNISTLLDPQSDNTRSLTEKWYSIEDAQSPDGHYFVEDYSQAKLSLLNMAYNESRPKMYSDGFSLQFQSSETAPMYQRDYKLGDLVGIEFGDKKGTGRVTQVEISYQAGSETIKPSVDAFISGSINSFKTEVKRLGESVSQIKNREV